MMHTYEGWQVAPFDSPLRGQSEDTNVVVSDKNNQWLRIVAYFFIFNRKIAVFCYFLGKNQSGMEESSQITHRDFWNFRFLATPHMRFYHQPL
jgi:hypothetical protein